MTILLGTQPPFDGGAIVLRPLRRNGIPSGHGVVTRVAVTDARAPTGRGTARRRRILAAAADAIDRSSARDRCGIDRWTARGPPGTCFDATCGAREQHVHRADQDDDHHDHQCDPVVVEERPSRAGDPRREEDVHQHRHEPHTPRDHHRHPPGAEPERALRLPATQPCDQRARGRPAGTRGRCPRRRTKPAAPAR